MEQCAWPKWSSLVSKKVVIPTGAVMDRRPIQGDEKQESVATGALCTSNNCAAHSSLLLA
jgi:hypothetical protein